MQYFPHGDLQSHISQALPIDETCTITRQILQGISFMHQNKVAHRDLKPAVGPDSFSLAAGHRYIHLVTLNLDPPLRVSSL